MNLLEYEGADGRSPFASWFSDLDARAAARVVIGLARLGLGNRSNVKSVGQGVLELKVDFGPGLRIYFAKEGPDVAILLGGGTKKGQRRDIAQAQHRWQDYKLRRKGA